ncbi:uncharacterized protein KGF55_001372 [Candida pseudojiufengensis]|uniref:uncharacterized protein n=1 Tax=Candida pseudojiufengensis TaxID=497109 RepID=UPI0022242038|nr:uncharacterized protein KGF55_001372 [Candida pseudojiufengensis]KAI5965152.1 hypothetical protein KGF55_001372 [Candida pseudojiufengensis]
MKNILKLSKEVQNAIRLNKPIVSLESTIISHGLPYPQNLEMVKSVESIIRENDVIPATTAFLNGIPHIGLTEQQLIEFAETPQSKIQKVSRRDMGYVMANKLNGGTTVSQTMILSKIVGINFFATGGLGGVHRNLPGEFDMDISADLTELGRTSVSVICAGPKSILDIPKTLEFLETQGVFVGTYNEDKLPLSELYLPGFYSRESSTLSPFGFNNFEEAAKITYNQNLMGLQSGNVFCIPPPKDTSLNGEFINKIIDESITKARNQGIYGKKLTPFLLNEINLKTNGKSVECNISLVKNNAKAAAEIAKEYHKLTNQNYNQSQVSQQVNIDLKELKQTKVEEDLQKLKTSKVDEENLQTNLIVVGSIALDTIATINTKTKLKDSNIGKISNSIGGVGFNIALASYYTNPTSIKFISRIGNDFSGDLISNEIKIDSKLIKGEGSTAQYVVTHDSNGELIIAVADMSIMEENFSKEVIQEIELTKPNVVVLDCNLSSTTINEILNFDYPKIPNFIIEPTSYIKAKKLESIDLQVFPQNRIKLITPTIEELNTIFESFEIGGKFDDYDNWFPVLDAMNINTLFREKIEKTREFKSLDLSSNGIFQQCFSLLPFFQNILIKLGSKGCILFSLVTNAKDLKSIPTTSKYKPTTTIINDKNSRLGIIIEYFDIPIENKNLDIKNVTGAGDSMIGYIASKLSTSENNWLDCEITSIEQIWEKWECIYKSQLASGLSLISENSINPKIKDL